MKSSLPFLFLFLANALAAQSGSLVKVENAMRVYPLDSCTLLFADSTRAMTFGDVSKENFQEKFQPQNLSSLQGQADRVYWLKVQITAADSLSDWLLLLKNTHYDKLPNRSVYTAGNCYVDGYFVRSNGEIVHERDGFYLPKSERKIYRHPLLNALSFSLPKGDTATVFVRVYNPGEDWTALSLELRPKALGIPAEKTGFANLMGISMGVTGILAVLCIFFFLADRDPANLFFSLFCINLMLHYSMLHNEVLFVSWFIPEHPWFVEYVWIFSITAGMVFFILFGRYFVNLRQYSLLLDRLMLSIAGGLLFLFFINILSHTFSWRLNLTWAITASMIGVISISIRIGFIKNSLAKIFTFGAVWLLFFNCLGLLFNKEVFTLFNPWPVGQMGLMVIYTFGLAYKLQLNERAKSDVKRILELDAVKSRFFASISHEFRTPLTLILGPLKKAQEQLPASDQEIIFENNNTEINLPANHLGIMRRNAERLGQLIDQLLDLSKLENGRMKLQVAEGDVVKFLRAMVFSFESLAERRQIHFQTSFPEEEQMVFFDRDKLEKIIANLLSNAFKYTPEKGRVSVKTCLEKGRLKITVEDSGPGISKDDLDKIFERFYQVEGTEDRGSGIGLNLVKELVELHRGQISVESSVGKGAIFKVSLPVTREAFTEGETINNGKNEKAEVFFHPPGIVPIDQTSMPTSHPSDLPLLLIVEDNPDLRQFIGEIMQGYYQILAAKNGKLGLETAIDRTPDLIISDVMMPEMDGFEMCEILKKDERTSHIPIILLTAKAGRQHKVAGLETGADAYLTKPFDEQELLVQARNLVEQRRKLRERFSGPSVAGNLKPGEITITSADQRFLDKVTAAIEENMSNEFFSVEDLASAVAFSRSQLHRKLKALTGKSPNELIRDFRLTRAKELLEKGHGNVSEVAIEVGYSSLSYFTRSFKEAFGVPPSRS